MLNQKWKYIYILILIIGYLIFNAITNEISPLSFIFLGLILLLFLIAVFLDLIVNSFAKHHITIQNKAIDIILLFLTLATVLSKPILKANPTGAIPLLYYLLILLIFIVITFYLFKNLNNLSEFGSMSEKQSAEIISHFGYFLFLFITIVFADNIVSENKINWVYVGILILLCIFAVQSICRKKD